MGAARPSLTMQQPMNTGQPGTYAAAPDGGQGANNWDQANGLFGCFDDFGGCLLASFCGSCVAGRTHFRAGLPAGKTGLGQWFVSTLTIAPVASVEQLTTGLTERNALASGSVAFLVLRWRRNCVDRRGGPLSSLCGLPAHHRARCNPAAGRSPRRRLREKLLRLLLVCWLRNLPGMFTMMLPHPCASNPRHQWRSLLSYAQGHVHMYDCLG